MDLYVKLFYYIFTSLAIPSQGGISGNFGMGIQSEHFMYGSAAEDMVVPFIC
jgi:hypothetical protein